MIRNTIITVRPKLTKKQCFRDNFETGKQILLYNRLIQSNDRTVNYRFRNITRILDCVACEKCRVWGKLYFLGLGTAIKILLMPYSVLSDQTINPAKLISRQELVAMFNLLNQLAKAVQFASKAIDKELNYKIAEAVGKSAVAGGYSALAALAVYVLITLFLKFRKVFKGGRDGDSQKSD